MVTERLAIALEMAVYMYAVPLRYQCTYECVHMRNSGPVNHSRFLNNVLIRALLDIDDHDGKYLVSWSQTLTLRVWLRNTGKYYSALVALVDASSMDLSDKPHQPLSFNYTMHEFGKKVLLAEVC